METIRPSAVTEEVNSPTTSQEASYSPAKEMRDRRGCRSENLRIWPTLPREEFTGPLGAHAYIQQCIRTGIDPANVEQICECDNSMWDEVLELHFPNKSSIAYSELVAGPTQSRNTFQVFISTAGLYILVLGLCFACSGDITMHLEVPSYTSDLVWLYWQIGGMPLRSALRCAHNSLRLCACVWHLRQVALELSGLLVLLLDVCTKEKCPAMKASDEWVFLCAAHRLPQEVRSRSLCVHPP
eukprot:6798745-Pyramimonas_sp.AAC.2